MPSRLKGIETFVAVALLLLAQGRHSLNVPSRLKGIETLKYLSPYHEIFCLNVPSRLKGMETL